jgi:FtsZ-interacting cell division protein ZipA
MIIIAYIIAAVVLFIEAYTRRLKQSSFDTFAEIMSAERLADDEYREQECINEIQRVITKWRVPQLRIVSDSRPSSVLLY